MRSRIVVSGSVVLIVSGVAGCASGARGGSPSPALQAAVGDLGPANLQWSGRFRPVQQQLATVGTRGRNTADGTILLTAPDDRETHVKISVSGPVEDAQQLSWEIAPGACRSGTIPLLAVSQFPEIRFSRGHADLDQTISLPLPTQGTLHVNIFDGNGTEESDVLTCADLKLERRGASH